jgi:enamine deaminase RidA (YjgF/YER057c/UK114 family)
MPVKHINPDSLIKSPAFTNVVVVTGAAKTIYVGGQDSVDASGKVIGKGDFKAQVEQVYKNLQTALKAAGADLHDVIKWNIYVVQGQNFQDAVEVFQKFWGKAPNPPLITVAVVAGLGNPDWLVEMDAIAVVSE